tara:strand:- start:895 stop:1281 length:387 start_codon:yes stop_codon:yes gene_type:complete
MAKVDLNKNVFDKTKFNKSVDTSFSQLVPKPEQMFFDLDLATINDFFTLYTNFFYEIPKEGLNNSHEYLIRESTEYTNYQQTNDDIQVLLSEITSLREEMVTLEIQNVNLQQKLAEHGIDPSDVLTQP